MFAEMFHQAAATRLSNKILFLSLPHAGTTLRVVVCWQKKKKPQRVDYCHIAAAVTQRPGQIWTCRAGERGRRPRPLLVSSISTFARLAAAIVTAVSGGRNASRL